MSSVIMRFFLFFFFKQKTAYEMRISDWSSDVCSSDLTVAVGGSPVSWDCARVGRDRHRANRAAAAQRKRVGSMTDSFPGLTSTGNAGARRANRDPSAGPGGAGVVGADMHPACSTSNVGCNEQRPPRPAPAAEGYAGQAAREPPVDLAACRACGPLSGTIVLDRGGGRMPAGRLLRRAHAREAVVQPAFDRIAVDVEHPQLVVGHDFVQAVLGLLAVQIGRAHV